MESDTNITFTIKAIGMVRSPFKDPKGVPLQSTTAKKIKGTIEIYQEYEPGLQDIEGFSHIIVIFRCHLAKKANLEVIPYMDTKKHGVFSTRSPSRPNLLGLSIVKIIKRESNILYIEGMDMVDGTPVIDIKPYVPKFDRADALQESIKIGWLEKTIHKMEKTVDDGRFLKK